VLASSSILYGPAVAGDLRPRKNYAPRHLSRRGGGKRLALSLPIDWIALLLGLFAAFVVEFLRYASPNFGPPKSPYKIVEIGGKAVSTGKINWAALLTSGLYVAIGGATTVILEPTTVFQAIGIGAGWQAVFTNIVGTRPS